MVQELRRDAVEIRGFVELEGFGGILQQTPRIDQMPIVIVRCKELADAFGTFRHKWLGEC